MVTTVRSITLLILALVPCLTFFVTDSMIVTILATLVVLFKEINQIVTNQKLAMGLARLKQRFINLFKKQVETSSKLAEHGKVPHVFASVTFDSDGTVAIDTSFNVDSITVNGIGDVTVNLDKSSHNLVLPQGSSEHGTPPSVKIESPSTLSVKWGNKSKGKVYIYVHEMRDDILES